MDHVHFIDPTTGHCATCGVEDLFEVVLISAACEDCGAEALREVSTGTALCRTCQEIAEAKAGIVLNVN